MLASQGSLSLREAVNTLSVSEMTLRRDFINLERSGLAERTWGGLLAKQRLVAELSIMERQQREPAAKQAIAELANARIEEGETIFLSGGSTALAVSQQLVHRANLTIITTSLTALKLLSENIDLIVIALGGRTSPYNDDLTGPQVLDALEHYRADKAVIGASGITEEGVFNANIERSAINRKMIAHARMTLIVTDHSKVGRNALTLITRPGPAVTLVTDGPLPARLREAFRDAACEVVYPRRTSRRDGRGVHQDTSIA